MLASLRTYRVLSAFVALAVLLGTGFPLVHHLCGMAGEASAASPPVVASMGGEGGQHLTGHLQDRRGAHAEHHPGEDAPLHNGCETPTCSMEAAEPLPAVSVDHQPPERLLILPAALLFEWLDLAPSAPLLQAYRGAAEAPAPSFIPLRLLTSTFLL